MYKYFWDLKYDWGLFQITSKDDKGGYSKLFLREQLKYPPWFYYISMVYDFFGLFSWAMAIVLLNIENKDSDEQSQTYFNNLMYITWIEYIINFVRRTVWVVIRVESEFYNNFEQYRDVVTIPPMIQDGN